MNRKSFIKNSLAVTAGYPLISCLNHGSLNDSISWDSKDLIHIIPTVNHESVLLSTSFRRSLSHPKLRIGNQSFQGVIADGEGFHYRFYANGLEPSTTYSLMLEQDGELLADPWQVKTFPSPLADPDHLRLMIYTCAGGHPLGQNLIPVPKDQREPPQHYSMKRKALLQRGLSFEPDAIVAIGDSIYWDLSGNGKGRLGASEMPEAIEIAGKFDPKLPILNSANEAVLKKAVSPQIADFYGTHCRSTPMFFFNDDHDYFENDEANEELVTFPPKAWNISLARAVQKMYYPEFLPDIQRPTKLPGSSSADRVKGSSESFGTLRFGRLAELLMYDCRRFVTLAGKEAQFIPESAEKWLYDRTNSQEVKHTIHLPSTPYGWSAGKWLEWYPDLLGTDGMLRDDLNKYMWQKGWQLQHDRILKSMSEATFKKAVSISGDLHTFAYGQILSSGETSFDHNPIHSLTSGPLSNTVFPSTFRKVKATAPQSIRINEAFENYEENGFSIVDIDAAGIHVKMYKYLWNRDDLSLIPDLTHFTAFTI